MTDTLTQRVAEAICRNHGFEPDDKLNEEPVVRAWESFIGDAQTAIEVSGAKHIPALAEALKFYANNVSTEKYSVANKVLAALPPELRGEK